jgi:hypothetical protein
MVKRAELEMDGFKQVIYVLTWGWGFLLRLIECNNNNKL